MTIDFQEPFIQVLQIKLTSIDVKTGQPIKDCKVVEINNSFVDRFILDMHDYGFTGHCECFSLRLDEETLKAFQSLAKNYPVKIELLVQYQTQLQDCHQLILSGYLSGDLPVSIQFEDFISNDAFKKVYALSCKLSFSFCDPMTYWLKQINVRKFFIKKTYSDVLKELVAPFSNFFTLKVDDKTSDFQSERRIINALAETEDDTLYDYLIFILEFYQLRLRFDYQALQQKVESYENTLAPPKNEISWPAKIDNPAYIISQRDNSADEAQIIDKIDWKRLDSYSCDVKTKKQNIFQTTNINAKLSGNYPVEPKSKLGSLSIPISSNIKETANKFSERLVNIQNNKMGPARIMTAKFKALPSFATTFFPYMELKIGIPFVQKDGSIKSFAPFDLEKVKLEKARLIFQNEDLLGAYKKIEDFDFISLDELKRFWGHEGQSVQYQIELIDSNDVLYSLPDYQLSKYMVTEGIIVTQSENKQNDSQSPDYLYKVEENKTKPIDSVTLDSIGEKAECYWVKIPELSDVIIQVPVKTNFTHAQIRMPLKNGTLVNVHCYPEYVDLHGVLETNLSQPVEKTKQTEALFFGGNQEMAVKANSDDTGKNQLLSIGVEIEGKEDSEKYLHTLKFDIKSNKTILQAES